MIRTTVFFIAVVAIAGAGCDYRSTAATAANGPGAPPTGGTCKIQFRRDALGSGGTPIPPTTDVVNGAEVSVTGTLVRSDADWVVIDQEHQQLWVPRQSVLLLEFQK